MQLLAFSIEGPSDHVTVVSRHFLAASLAVDQESGLFEERLELGLGSEPLTLDFGTVSVNFGDIVEEKDEGFRLLLSRGPESPWHQLGLGFAQKVDNGVVTEIAGDPNHENAAIIELPVEVLHLGFLGISKASVSHECFSCFLHCSRALIEEVDFSILLDQEALAEPAVSTSNI